MTECEPERCQVCHEPIGPQHVITQSDDGTPAMICPAFAEFIVDGRTVVQARP